MRWPRGKYNGRRIVGFRVIIALDVRSWSLRWGSIDYGSAFCFGPWRIWLSAEYEPQWRD